LFGAKKKTTVRRLGACLDCGSHLVQLRSWRERPDGRLRLETSCPECLRAEVGVVEPARALDWEDELARGREALERSYLTLLRENMIEELRRLHAALELDLVGPDDF
jgi:hypothetical protein